jgi:large subunit ribosomal protein L15
VEFQVVNVAQIAKLFPEGGVISITDLVNAGAVRKGELVKVLGNGEISVKVRVTANAFSDTAKQKIEAAGGVVVEI